MKAQMLKFDAKSDHSVRNEGYGDVLLTQAERASDDLSPREIEVARLAGQGLSNKEIALILDISHHTVSTHIRRIFTKLGMHSRVQLAIYLVAAQPI